MPVPLTISIDESLKKDLDALAEATHRSSDSLATIALRMFVEQETKIVADILEGMRQLERGEAVSHEEMEKQFAAWEAELESKHARTRKRAS